MGILRRERNETMASKSAQKPIWNDGLPQNLEAAAADAGVCLSSHAPLAVRLGMA